MTAKPEEILDLYRHDFVSFARSAFGLIYSGIRFEPNWHIGLMCDHLARCESGEIKRLIINMPPYSLKSFCASIALPAWVLGRNPARHIISIAGARSHRDDLASDLSLLMNADRYRSVFPHVALSETGNRWNLLHGGSWRSQALSTPLTNRAADIIIIDAPLSSYDAKKDAVREQVNEWFEANVEQRINPNANCAIILVTQRLHYDDLTGHLLAKDNDWTHLCLPAVAESEESWSTSDGSVHIRHPGELIFPERESAQTLADILRKIGASQFAAQYQQSPFTPPDLDEAIGGSYFRYDENGKEQQVFGRVSKAAIMLHELFGIGNHPRPPELNCPEAEERRAKEWHERVANEGDKPRPDYLKDMNR